MCERNRLLMGMGGETLIGLLHVYCHIIKLAKVDSDTP